MKTKPQSRVKTSAAEPVPDAPAALAHETHRRSMIHRLRRVEGQLRGIQNMIEQNADCETVAQQVSAARRALDRAFYEIIACAMESEIETSPDLLTARTAGRHIARILSKYG
jgi:DNA-binding FrmR family transcriptional regulator